MKLYRKGEQLHVNRVKRLLMIEPQVPYIYIATKDYDVFKKQIVSYYGLDINCATNNIGGCHFPKRTCDNVRNAIISSKAEG